MTVLALRFEFVAGRCFAADRYDRTRAEYPIHPERLFSALVASAARRGFPADEVAALEWLETLGAPAIRHDEHAARQEGATAFVPTNDDLAVERLKGAIKKVRGIGPARERKPRTFPSVGLTDPRLFYIWPDAGPDAAGRHAPALGRILADVDHLGDARSIVVGALEAEPPAPTLVPAAGGRHRLRMFHPGRLRELRETFAADPGGRPEPGPAARYARAAEGGDRPVAEPVYGEMLAFRRVAGQRIGLADFVRVAETVRDALMSRSPQQPPRTVLSGHEPDGSATARPHLAVVPLAHVGHEHADGNLLGFGLVLPAAIGDDDRRHVYAAVAGGSGDGPTELDLRLTAAFAWRVAPAPEAAIRTLDPATYRRASRRWLSVTPVAFDRHPRRSAGRTVLDVARRMCASVGLPEPVACAAGPSSGWLGGPPAHRFHLSRRGYLSRLYIAHLELTFDAPVEGPVLLGAGRHFGLGFLRPAREAAG